MATKSDKLQSVTTHFECPTCGEKGKPVKEITLQTLLKPEAKSRISVGSYRFCGSENCEVVYFSETRGSIFNKDELLVRVGIKETLGPRHLCYCFDHSIEEIEDQVHQTGDATVLEDIKTRMKEACWCETKSPMGSCCLATVTKHVKAAKAKYGSDVVKAETMEEEDCCSAQHSQSTLSAAQASDWSRKAQKVAWAGSILSAVVASACCWLPLLLLGGGVSGVAVSATFEQYRSIFMVVTFGFIAAAFYFAYRPVKVSSTEEGEAWSASGKACCPPAKVWTLQRLNRAMLWVVTVVAVSFLFFPSYIGAFLEDRESLALNDNYDTVTLSISGMTCEACATTLKNALVKVPGVSEAEVNYEKNEAIVGFPKGADAPRNELLAAVSAIGYSGQFKDLQRFSLPIEGMTCEACASGLQVELANVPGVSSVKVEYDIKKAVIMANQTVTREALAKAIKESGYEVSEEFPK